MIWWVSALGDFVFLGFPDVWFTCGDVGGWVCCRLLRSVGGWFVGAGVRVYGVCVIFFVFCFWFLWLFYICLCVLLFGLWMFVCFDLGLVI